MESDYPVAEEILNAEVPVLPQETVVSTGTQDAGQSGENSGIGGITFVQCSTGVTAQGLQMSPVGSPHGSKGSNIIFS